MLAKLLMNEELMDCLRVDLEMLFEEHGLCDENGKFLTQEEFSNLTDKEILDYEIQIWGMKRIVETLFE